MSIFSSGFASLKNKIDALQGGTATNESIATQLESILDVARNALSGSYTPTVGVGETTVYEVTPTAGTVQVIPALRIDTTNMVAGDTLIIRRYLKNITGGAYLLSSDDAIYTYKDVQVNKLKTVFTETWNTYGCKYVIVQSEGTARAFVAEILDAAPGI